jgi:hypothetical protein
MTSHILPRPRPATIAESDPTGESGHLSTVCGERPDTLATHGIHEYAVEYPHGLVRDPSWTCIADVIASYAGGYYCDDAGRVTGVLVRAVRGTDEWEPVQ